VDAWEKRFWNAILACLLLKTFQNGVSSQKYPWSFFCKLYDILNWIQIFNLYYNSIILRPQFHVMVFFIKDVLNI
jgi:hypothetical protein